MLDCRKTTAGDSGATQARSERAAWPLRPRDPQPMRSPRSAGRWNANAGPRVASARQNAGHRFTSSRVTALVARPCEHHRTECYPPRTSTPWMSPPTVGVVARNQLMRAWSIASGTIAISTTPRRPVASRVLAQRQLPALGRRLARRAPAEDKKQYARRTLISSQQRSPGDGCARSLKPLAVGGGSPAGGMPPATASARPRSRPRCPHLACGSGAFGSSGGGWHPRSIRYLANASRSRPGWNGSVPSLRSWATRSRP